jgi:hypothetical protein
VKRGERVGAGKRNRQRWRKGEEEGKERELRGKGDSTELDGRVKAD